VLLRSLAASRGRDNVSPSHLHALPALSACMTVIKETLVMS
jgi:hypothetical protein